MGQLSNQIAVVTGAGRGIGRAIALQFAAEGADVACVSRTVENSEKVAVEIRALGRKAWAHAVDVADAAAVAATAEKILGETARVDILVNNAGMTEEIRAGILKQIPLGALGRPEDIANAALFLAGPASKYITGQVLTVDGGMVM